MEGNKRSHFLHLCGQLLRLVLIPCHVEGELHPWTRSTALSFAAEIDGHVLGTLCAVTMALLTNRLDLCIQGLFGAGKSKSMAILILALIEIDTTDSLKILFICKENSGTRSFADLLLWLDPPSGVFGRIGRLVGDQEQQKQLLPHEIWYPPKRKKANAEQVSVNFSHRGNGSPGSYHAMVHNGWFYARALPPGHWWRPAVWYWPRDCSYQPAETATPGLVDRRLWADTWRHRSGSSQRNNCMDCEATATITCQPTLPMQWSDCWTVRQMKV